MFFFSMIGNELTSSILAYSSLSHYNVMLSTLYKQNSKILLQQLLVQCLFRVCAK